MVVAGGCEQLLELIDDQEQRGGRSMARQQRLDRHSERGNVAFERRGKAFEGPLARSKGPCMEAR